METKEVYAERLKTIIDRIEADPSCWEQSTWHCGATHCLAGHAQIDSGKEPNCDTVRRDARIWLGLTQKRADTLFSSRSTIDDFKRFHSELLSGHIGYDQDGYASNGYNRYDYDRYGYDSDGLNANLQTPWLLLQEQTLAGANTMNKELCQCTAAQQFFNGGCIHCNEDTAIAHAEQQISDLKQQISDLKQENSNLIAEIRIAQNA